MGVQLSLPRSSPDFGHRNFVAAPGHVDLTKNEIHVRQRADKFNVIGKPKSEAGERVVPFGKFVANTLKEWKLACPRSELDLVFPTATGKIHYLPNIVDGGLKAAQIAVGVTVEGKAKYTGWCRSV